MSIVTCTVCGLTGYSEETIVQHVYEHIGSLQRSNDENSELRIQQESLGEITTIRRPVVSGWHYINQIRSSRGTACITELHAGHLEALTLTMGDGVYSITRVPPPTSSRGYSTPPRPSSASDSVQELPLSRGRRTSALSLAAEMGLAATSQPRGISQPTSLKVVENEALELHKECSICLLPFSIKQVVITRCNHKFHKECLMKWLKGRATCPVCRQEID